MKLNLNNESSLNISSSPQPPATFFLTFSQKVTEMLFNLR